ncbi:MAG TPA: MASE1 domain-containing protein [Holophagaceae bacterium]|nr:MASE1 domain-containing protein [Holophagaceae bacterium]
MASAPRQSRLLRLLGLNLAIALAYVAGKALGKAPISGGFSPVWPPTGIALASLVLFGREALPGVAIGCLSSLGTSGLPWLPSLGIALANFTEASLGAWILHRGGFRATLARTKDVLLLTIPVAVLGALVGATLGCLSLALALPGGLAEAFRSWWSWSMEDLLGVLVVAPPILTLASRQRLGDRPLRRRIPEGALLLVAAALLGCLVFGGAVGDVAIQFGLTYALFPLVLAAADRHGPRGASLATFLTAASALAAGHFGMGPLGRAEGREYLILLAGFLALLALTALLLAAAGSERRERARQLRGQARLMEMATESIGMAGLGGRVLQLNAAGRSLFGLGPKSTLSGLRVLNLIAPEDRRRFQETILPQVLEQGSWSGELAILDLSTGESIPTRHFLFRIDNPQDGRAEAFGAIGHDLREALREEAAFRQTQRLESLGVLAGGIAHDYNNLLTAVMGHLDLARELVAPSHPAQEHLLAASTLAERSGALTRQILDYAGKGPAARERLDPRRLVLDLTELLKSSISKKAELVLDLEDPLPPLLGDPVQLEQVVMNLLVNASEALEGRAGRIHLSLRAARLEAAELGRRFPGFDLAAGTYVVLSVVDDGCGMAPEVRERIFDPFFTTKFEGRGLGLSALRGILQAHGGGVEVLSEPGKGSAFTLVLPAAGD